VIDDQERDAAPAELGRDRGVDELLHHVEAVEMHHAGLAARSRGLDEIGGQLVRPIRHLDELDRIAPQFEASAVERDAAPIRVLAARVVMARHPLGEQEVKSGAEIFATGGKRMARLFVHLREPLDAFREFHPILEPCRLRRRIVLAAGDFAQRPTGVVDLRDLTASIDRGHHREAPGVIVGEILEHRCSPNFAERPLGPLLRLDADPLDHAGLEREVLLQIRAELRRPAE
jgi:hypothetical protein